MLGDPIIKIDSKNFTENEPNAVETKDLHNQIVNAKARVYDILSTMELMRENLKKMGDAIIKENELISKLQKQKRELESS